MEKIRCDHCGAVLAIKRDGYIEIICKHAVKKSGKNARCYTVKRIEMNATKERESVDEQT